MAEKDDAKPAPRCSSCGDPLERTDGSSFACANVGCNQAWLAVYTGLAPLWATASDRVDRPVPTRWEYHVENDPDVESDWAEISSERFNELGAEGWELISVGWHQHRGVRPVRAVFRRPLGGDR